MIWDCGLIVISHSIIKFQCHVHIFDSISFPSDVEIQYANVICIYRLHMLYCMEWINNSVWLNSHILLSCLSLLLHMNCIQYFGWGLIFVFCFTWSLSFSYLQLCTSCFPTVKCFNYIILNFCTDWMNLTIPLNLILYVCLVNINLVGASSVCICLYSLLYIHSIWFCYLLFTVIL